MLLGTLLASSSGNILAGWGAIATSRRLGINRAGKVRGINWAGEGAVATRQGRGIVWAGYENKNNKMDF